MIYWCDIVLIFIQRGDHMGSRGITDTIEDAISRVGEIGIEACEAIRGFAESESAERFTDGMKTGAGAALSGIAKGAKMAASGIKEGGHIAKDAIKARRSEREDNRIFRLNNGVEIPAVGYGTYLSTEKNGKQTILNAFDAGYRYIDTARFYENEDEIGEALRECGINRDEIFICSKVWPTMLGKEKLRESFEASCKSLGTDHLDMYLIHWPKVSQKDDEWISKLQASWETMEELYEEGRIRAIGLSNFLPHHIRPLLKSARIKPMLDQLELHVGYMQEYALQYLKKEKITAQAWSPLGRARVLNDERITGLAEKYGKSGAQIMLRYLIQRGIPVIPKASTPERMRENLEVFDFSLSRDEISYLSCLPQEGWSGEHPDIAELM